MNQIFAQYGDRTRETPGIPGGRGLSAYCEPGSGTGLARRLLLAYWGIKIVSGVGGTGQSVRCAPDGPQFVGNTHKPCLDLEKRNTSRIKPRINRRCTLPPRPGPRPLLIRVLRPHSKRGAQPTLPGTLRRFHCRLPKPLARRLQPILPAQRPHLLARCHRSIQH